VSELITAIDTEDDIWMAGPMQYDYDKKKLDPIFLRWYLCDVEDIQTDAFNNNVRKYYYAKRIQGACILIKKDMLDHVGAFDENYFMYSEDDDLCRKVIYSGKKIVLVPSARIAHYHSNVKAKKRDREQIAEMQSRSRAIYFLKDINSNFLLNLIKLKKNDIVDYINSFLSLKISDLFKKLYIDSTLLMRIFSIYRSWKQEKDAVERIRNI
jgi:GT2 family glycosyltransferase